MRWDLNTKTPKKYKYNYILKCFVLLKKKSLKSKYLNK